MQLTWPDELKPYLERQARAAGCPSIDEYVLQIFMSAQDPESDVDWDSAVEALDVRSDELERELLVGLQSGPATPMTQDDWTDLRRRVEQRLSGSK